MPSAITAAAFGLGFYVAAYGIVRGVYPEECIYQDYATLQTSGARTNFLPLPPQRIYKTIENFFRPISRLEMSTRSRCLSFWDEEGDLAHLRN